MLLLEIVWGFKSSKRNQTTGIVTAISFDASDNIMNSTAAMKTKRRAVLLQSINE
jgi:hypothetical protein